MTFDEWYLQEIKKSQDWYWDYKQSYYYKGMERAWSAGYEEGHCKGYQEGLKDDPF